MTSNFGFAVGIEARGFIFGPPIALAIGAKFVPLRKPRKLPGNIVYSGDAHLEYINIFWCGLLLKVFLLRESYIYYINKHDHDQV